MTQEADAVVDEGMRQETRERWAARVAHWQASGLAAKAFVDHEGINPRSLTWWA